jgi:hypothetical protein
LPSRPVTSRRNPAAQLPAIGSASQDTPPATRPIDAESAKRGSVTPLVKPAILVKLVKPAILVKLEILVEPEILVELSSRARCGFLTS